MTTSLSEGLQFIAEYYFMLSEKVEGTRYKVHLSQIAVSHTEYKIRFLFPTVGASFSFSSMSKAITPWWLFRLIVVVYFRHVTFLIVVYCYHNNCWSNEINSDKRNSPKSMETINLFHRSFFVVRSSSRSDSTQYRE